MPMSLQEKGSGKITPFVFSATGTGGWESAIQNTLSPGAHPDFSNAMQNANDCGHHEPRRLSQCTITWLFCGQFR